MGLILGLLVAVAFAVTYAIIQAVKFIAEPQGGAQNKSGKDGSTDDRKNAIIAKVIMGIFLTGLIIGVILVIIMACEG